MQCNNLASFQGAAGKRHSTQDLQSSAKRRRIRTIESSDEDDESSADEFKPGKDEQSSDEDSESGEEEKDSEGSEAEQTPRRKIKPKVSEVVKISDLFVKPVLHWN